MRLAPGLVLLTLFLLNAPLALSLDVSTSDTSVNAPVSCCPKPPSAQEQVQSGVQSAVNTAGDAVSGQASASPAAQPSPLPTTSAGQLTNALALSGGTDAGSTPDPEPSVASRGTAPTSSAAPAASKSSQASAVKCSTAVCASSHVRVPNLAGAAGGASDVGGAAEINAGEEAGPGRANVKDLTDAEAEAQMSPPAAVPGFGPLFALAGLAVLVWARRRGGA